MIKSPITNDYINLKLDNENGGANTEIYQKVLIQVFVRELLMEMVKKDATEF